MSNKLRMLIPFLVMVNSSIIGQTYQGKNLDLKTVYRMTAEIFGDLNKGNESTAQIRIDSILNVQSSNFNDVIWGFLFDYQGMILHHQGNYYLSKKFFELL